MMQVASAVAQQSSTIMYIMKNPMTIEPTSPAKQTAFLRQLKKAKIAIAIISTTMNGWGTWKYGVVKV